MKTGTKIALWLLALWLLAEAEEEEKREEAQDLYDEWYSPEKIADELDMDEDEVKDIVWDVDFD